MLTHLTYRAALAPQAVRPWREAFLSRELAGGPWLVELAEHPHTGRTIRSVTRPRLQLARQVARDWCDYKPAPEDAIANDHTERPPELAAAGRSKAKARR